MSQEILGKVVIGWLLISVIAGILRDIYLTYQISGDLSEYLFSLVAGSWAGLMCGTYVAIVGVFFWCAIQVLFYQ